MEDETDAAKGHMLDPQRPVPLHYQLRQILKYQALNGSLADDSGRVPTEAELSKRFKVSRITVRRALRELENQGLLLRERGRGTFLKSNDVENWSGQLLGFTEAIQAAGFEPGSKILRRGFVENPQGKVQKVFLGERVWELKRLRLADRQPIAIEHAFFPKNVGMELEKHDLNAISLYRFMETDMNLILHEGKQTISAVNATREEADILEVAEGRSLLYMERVTYSLEGGPVEFLIAVYRPDYFQYSIRLKR